MKIVAVKYCTYLIDGATKECLRVAVVEYIDRTGNLRVRLCERHDTKQARAAAALIKARRKELS